VSLDCAIYRVFYSVLFRGGGVPDTVYIVSRVHHVQCTSMVVLLTIVGLLLLIKWLS